MEKFIHWWMGDKLPLVHVFPQDNLRLSMEVRRWFIHPLKRRLARLYLISLRKIFGLQVIGITGSVGKTTTKGMIAAVLSQKYKTIKSFANIDPVYNIPSTILKCTPQTKMLVLEMAIEYPGEMDFYLWFGKPDIGVLTNIYWTHTQFLGSVFGVAQEKGKLIRAVLPAGWAVLNIDDPRVLELSKRTKAEVVLYGIGKDATVRASKIVITNDLKTRFTLEIEQESCRVTLPVLGEHFVYAALSAAAVGHTQQIPLSLIKEGLEELHPLPHRMIPIKSKSGALILDDTYNSSPLGAKAAINTLVKVAGGKKTIAVLGDMLELGRYTEKGHKEVGKWTAKRGVDKLIAVGEYAQFLAGGAGRGGMKEKQIIIVDNTTEAKKVLKSLISPGTVVLLKASRKLKFDEILNTTLSP